MTCPRCGDEWLPHLHRCGACGVTKEEIVRGHRHDAILDAHGKPVPIGTVQAVEIRTESG
jgi:hypothetical protein